MIYATGEKFCLSVTGESARRVSERVLWQGFLALLFLAGSNSLLSPPVMQTATDHNVSIRGKGVCDLFRFTVDGIDRLRHRMPETCLMRGMCPVTRLPSSRLRLSESERRAWSPEAILRA